MNIEQEKLIAACIKKKAWAYKEIYNRYHPLLLGVCLRYARDKSEAEDILLKGLMNIFQKIHLYEYSGPFEAWLRKLMVNTAIDHYRKYKNERQWIDITDFENDVIFREDQISRLSEKEIIDVIQQLPAGYGMVFNLFVFEGYAHKEIAEMLNITESTSKTQLKKARTWLAKKLKGIK